MSGDPTSGPADRRHTRGAIALVLAVAALLRIAFAVATPAWQAPDEYPHFWYAQEIAITGTFPPPSAAFPGYEAFQPPLYYCILAGGLHVLTVNQPFTFEATAFPSLPLILLRLLSAAAGVGVVWCTWSAAGRLPDLGQEERLGAAWFAALLPAFAGVTASLNNDAAVAFFSAACLMLAMGDLRTTRSALLAGFFAGLALLSKTNALVLLPILAWRVGRTSGNARTVLRTSAWILAGGMLPALAGLAKNFAVTGTLLPLNTQVAHAWNLSPSAVLWALRNLGWSFWFAFGRVYTITLPVWVYVVAAVALLVPAVIGLLRIRPRIAGLPGFVMFSVLCAVAASLAYSLSFPPGTGTSWGKNLYPVLPLVAIGFSAGWRRSFPAQGKSILVASCALLGAGCLWGLIRVAQSVP